MKSWLHKFLSSCMCIIKTTKMCRRTLVVAILKPNMLPGDPKSYQSTLLLCIPFKILQHFLYAHVKSTIAPLLPWEPDGFQHGKSAIDQVTSLTQNIKESFLTKKKATAVLFDLTAAYITLWQHCLICKHLCLLPDMHMVKIIMEHVTNHSLTLTTGSGTHA